MYLFRRKEMKNHQKHKVVSELEEITQVNVIGNPSVGSKVYCFICSRDGKTYYAASIDLVEKYLNKIPTGFLSLVSINENLMVINALAKEKPAI